MKERAEQVLTDLVLLRSTSDDPAEPIVEYVSSRLKKLGLKPRLHGDPKRPAIVAQFETGGIALSGHLDTVPMGNGWTHDQAEVVEGVMYGRGSCDMKGGCTAMLMAAEELVAANVPFTLCFTTDEETTMVGAVAASKDPAIAGAPAVVITEPSDFNIVVKEKGLLQFSISTIGKAAHASMPELGENAIVKMVKLLTMLDDLQNIPDDTLNNTTMCVDKIKGGTRVNVIPGDCEVEIDVRYPPHMNTNSVLRLVRDRIGDDGYSIRILHELPPVDTDPTSDAVKTLKDVGGQSARVLAVPYATEMVMFRPTNRNVMVCGPGESKGCHIIDEKIEVAQVVKAVDLYVEYCSRMA